MTNWDDWFIKPVIIDSVAMPPEQTPAIVGHPEAIPGWMLVHAVCGWQSNVQDHNRSFGDAIRWISNHECMPQRHQLPLWEASSLT